MNDASDNAAADAPPPPPPSISAPLIFQCGSCKVIVGDSFSFVESREDVRMISLTAASNIQRSADVYTSKTGSDIGSTYFSFACSVCNNDLGKYYLTTSKDLDSLREKFTFYVDAISSYELGHAQHGNLYDAASPSPANSVGGELGVGAAGEGGGCAGCGDLATRVGELNDDIVKVGNRRALRYGRAIAVAHAYFHRLIFHNMLYIR